ncbi:MAG: class I SAM-dependent methyltransferase [Polyangiaceae bacterium]
MTGDVYREHHSGGNRYGFTFASDTRVPWFKREIARAADALGKTKLAILDIGCRDGTLTRQYTEGHAVTGLDVDRDAVARANQVPGVEARLLDLNNESIPAAEATFDVVVAGEVLEHLQWPSVVVKDIHRVLVPGGTFIGTVPNAFRLRNRIQFLLGRHFEVDPTHLRQFSPEGLRELLAAFESVHVEFHGGRRRDLHPRLMAANMHWVARKPR